MCRISGKNSPPVHLAEDHHQIQGLAAQCADETLCNPILPWRSRGDRPIADTHGPHPRRENMSIGAVVVAHQVGWRRVPRKRFGDLPSQPLGCRMPCHLEPQQLSPAVTQDQERKQEDQRSASAQRTYQLPRLPARDSAETSSRFAMAGSGVAPCISRPSTGPPQSQASEVRHGSGMRPKAGSPCSYAGSNAHLRRGATAASSFRLCGVLQSNAHPLSAT